MFQQQEQPAPGASAHAVQGTRATRLVWLLTAVTLCVGAAIAYVVRVSFEHARRSALSYRELEQRTEVNVREMEKCLDQARLAFDANISGALPGNRALDPGAAQSVAGRLRELLADDSQSETADAVTSALAALL